MDWTICEKKEDYGEEYHSNAAREALWWFFEKNGVGQNAARVYSFLKQFIGTEKINGDYGRLLFIAQGNGLELQKYTGHYGLHDDHSDVASVYLACASDEGQPSADWPIKVDLPADWKPLEDNNRHYRKEWFDGCGDVKVFIEEHVVMGSYYGKVTNPVFFISDIPGASGHYLLKLYYLDN